MAKEFNFSRVQRATRTYHCSECRQVIPPSTRCVYNFGYCEGNPYQGRLCFRCAPHFRASREAMQANA